MNLKINTINLLDLHTNKYLRLKDVEIIDKDLQPNALNVFVIDNQVNDGCLMVKSGICDLASNKLLVKYDQNTLEMSNNVIEMILNLINIDGCLNNRFNIADINLNEHEIDYKNCFLDANCVKNEQNKCGNGIVDAYEDCDCGGNNCDFKCCNPKTCKFQQKDYECSSGGCCNQCKLRNVGTICRTKTDAECDFEEKCDGLSSECPVKSFVHDGSSCTNGICYSGNCKNADNQCKQIWNHKSVSSDLSCYKTFNTIGFQNGNCASSGFIQNKYDACSSEDAVCGLINCQFGDDRPLITTESFFKSTTTIQDKQFECKVITNTTKTDLMYVNDGTLCNNNKICVNRKCINIPQLKCPVSNINKKLCSGNGLCSSQLKCICNEKWTGSACDYYLNETNNTNTFINQTVKNIDYKAPNVNTTSLLSIIAGFILIFLFIFVFSFLCHRRRRIRGLSSTSIDKIESHIKSNKINNKTTYVEDDGDIDNLNGSIKFGSLPSYKDYKLKNKSRSSLISNYPQQPTPTKIHNASMVSCGDNISETKLNHAIKQLNTQPCKSILKNKPNIETQQEYYEEISNNLNDTYTNTNINAKYSTFSKRTSLSISLTSTSSSSSSLSSSAPTLVIPVDIEIQHFDVLNTNDVTPTLNDIFLDDSKNYFQHKVQDYLNELNLLSKQNNFGVLEDAGILITPIKPIFSCDTIINTNNSETSSGYVSASNQNNMNYKDVGIVKNMCGSSESIIYDDGNEMTVVENEMRINEKRHSYILATASVNNLNIDPE
jgi:hypothetical protein